MGVLHGPLASGLTGKKSRPRRARRARRARRVGTHARRTSGHVGHLGTREIWPGQPHWPSASLSRPPRSAQRPWLAPATTAADPARRGIDEGRFDHQRFNYWGTGSRRVGPRIEQPGLVAVRRVGSAVRVTKVASRPAAFGARRGATPRQAGEKAVSGRRIAARRPGRAPRFASWNRLGAFRVLQGCCRTRCWETSWFPRHPRLPFCRQNGRPPDGIGPKGNLIYKLITTTDHKLIGIMYWSPASSSSRRGADGAVHSRRAGGAGSAVPVQ